MKALYITCLTLLISSSQIACAREMHVKSQMTPDQKHDLGVIESKYKDTVATRKGELLNTKKALQELLAADKQDRNRIMETQNRINVLNGEIASARLVYRIDTLASMSPEEREKIKARMQKLRAARKSQGASRKISVR